MIRISFDVDIFFVFIVLRDDFICIDITGNDRVKNDLGDNPPVRIFTLVFPLACRYLERGLLQVIEFIPEFSIFFLRIKGNPFIIIF